MKIAIVYDWIIEKGGGEKVLEEVVKLFPNADIFTLFYNKKKGHDYLKNRKVYTSILQKIPGVLPFYRSFLPLFPLAISQFNLKNYEVVLSISHSVAKAVKVKSHQLHLCYCFTPMRYAWDLQDTYLSSLPFWKQGVCKAILQRLKKWDVKSSSPLENLLANSHYIKERIEACWGKKAEVMYPPVDVSSIEMEEKKEDYYLTLSRFVPYKKIDLIVEAFSSMPDKMLLVIGDGPERKKIQKKAKNNVKLLGYLSDSDVKTYLKKAKAFIFAAEEDFGMVNVEAQAAGTPVLAFGKGGALETVVEGKTGFFFYEQTKEALIETVLKFEKEKPLNPHEMRRHALSFSKERFIKEFMAFVEGKAKSR